MIKQFYPPFLLILCFGLLLYQGQAQSTDPIYGEFQGELSFGSDQAGHVSYLSTDQEYLIDGGIGKLDTQRVQESGSREGQGHFLWKAYQGDFILTSRVRTMPAAKTEEALGGLMIRNDLGPESRALFLSMDAKGGVHWHVKDSLNFKGHGAEGYEWLELERSGNDFILRAAKDGQPMEYLDSLQLNLKREFYIGLFVQNVEQGEAEEGNRSIFRDLRLTRPAAENWSGDAYLGSRLEVLDVETGLKKVLLEMDHRIEAPNWTQDGERLIFNSNGLLYAYSMESGSLEVINTGFANDNNNDHVLSFDGRQLAISHHLESEDHASTIYVLPIEGSDQPQRVTAKGKGASYLHGWSPDGKYLAFTGLRSEQYDVYEVEIATGKEKQLTNTPFLDDGPEYGPEGQWIYFNSNRSGSMDLYRTDREGERLERLTDDTFQNWFPHLSPQGDKIVYLSYLPDVDSGVHPYYQRVMLRMLDKDWKTASVLTHLYGGQGSMNVPSWSPDGRYIAFVSHTGRH